MEMYSDDLMAIARSYEYPEAIKTFLSKVAWERYSTLQRIFPEAQNFGIAGFQMGKEFLADSPLPADEWQELLTRLKSMEMLPINAYSAM